MFKILTIQRISTKFRQQGNGFSNTVSVTSENAHFFDIYDKTVALYKFFKVIYYFIREIHLTNLTNK